VKILAAQFDDHDVEQLELLAHLNKITMAELLRRICQAYLDKRKANLQPPKAMVSWPAP